jgi:hypothetical protein
MHKLSSHVINWLILAVDSANLAYFLYICNSKFDGQTKLSAFDFVFQFKKWGRFGFDRVALSMLACSALYGEHLKENVQNNNWRK